MLFSTVRNAVEKPASGGHAPSEPGEVWFVFA
jgi:hypothetical protein